MAFYGYIRCCPLKGEQSFEVQTTKLARAAKELGEPLVETFVDRGDSRKRISVLNSAAGKEMLEALRSGDTLIATRLSRLGYSMRDLEKTVKALSERNVQIYVLDAFGGQLDLVPAAATVVLRVSALLADTEKALRSERATETAQWRKEHGLACGHPPTAQKIVEKDGLKILEWDMQQLEYIAQIAERIATEPVEKIAKDFWARGIKDRHGRPWGMQTPKPFSRYRSPYQQFYRAARWFHRMKRKGLLPYPYDVLGLLMEEPEGFREEPRPKGWTPGGTARREQERAEAKAQHRAERLRRWEAEKAARVQSRVHKPALTRLKTENQSGPARSE